MGPEFIGLLGFAALFLLIFLRAPVGLSLLFVGLGGLVAINPLSTVFYVAATGPVETLTSYTLSVLPLFVLMGNFAVKTGLSGSLYRVANAFVGHRRGGLAAATIMACGGFGAICGSSLATVSTMTKIAAPEMLRYNYSPRLTAGAVGAGGTLGILIPPSLIMIIYAYLTETSVGKLFAAGVVPGILAIFLYCVAIFVWVRIRPEDGPAQPRVPWLRRLVMLKETIGVLAIFLTVIGGIFVGAFSPTEGAAVGAFATLALGVGMRRLDWPAIVESLRDTVSVTAMLFLLILGIHFFHFFMEASRLPNAVVDFFNNADAPSWVIIAGIVLLLVLLGCVLDSVAIVIIMTPFLFPVIVKHGFDPIWFGIVMVMVVEVGLLTPPFGINVFVINSLIPQITIGEAFKGVVPFIAADIVRVGLVIAAPGIVLWLPGLVVD